MENVTQKTEKSISGAIKINEKEIGDHLNQLVRQSVEDTINSLLDAEADAICNATRYQHSPDRLDSRAGSYKRKLLTTSGEVELTVPRLRRLPFETQIIQRYQTKQSSVEKALIEMYSDTHNRPHWSDLPCGIPLYKSLPYFLHPSVTRYRN